MGSGYNQQYVDATKYQADTNASIANDTNSSTLEAEKVKSEAVIKQAELDYKARIYEADKNFTIQMEALRVREKEAELQFKVDWKNAQNDGIRAEASMVKAEADMEENEVNREENQQDYEIKMARQESSSGDYWYG